MDTLPTVSVDIDGKPVRINQSDLTDQHVLSTEQPDWSALHGQPLPGAAVTPPPAPPPPADQQPNQPLAPIPPAPGTPNTPPAPPPPAAPAETFVSKIEEGWFIVDGQNKPVDGLNGDDGKGFKTKKEAEEAKAK